MSQLSDLPQVFRSAAMRIQTHGCYRGEFAPADAWPDCPTCMVGAILLVTTGSPFRSSELADMAIRFASQHMTGSVPETDGEPDYVEHLAAWNDSPERTAGQVVARLRRLALDAEQEAREAALLCRYIAEHDDHLPCDWCQQTRDEYLSELRTLRLAVAA